MVGAALLLAGLALAGGVASADHGPKPAQDFSLVYQTSQSVTVRSADLLQCEDPQCARSVSIHSWPIAWLNCDNTACHAGSPTGFRPYQQLVITFSDRARSSQVFAPSPRRDFGHQYTVFVTDTALRVEEQFSAYMFVTPYQVVLFLPALLFTLVVELGAALLFAVLTHRPKGRLLLTVGLVNLVTVPVIWFAFPLLQQVWDVPAGAVILLSELFVLVCEGAVLYTANRATLSGRTALGLSLLLNAASFLTGLCAAFFAG